MKKIYRIIFILVLSFSLVSCVKSSFNMPIIEGPLITFTETELNSKLEELAINEHELITYIKVKGEYDYNLIGEPVSIKYSSEIYHDMSNDDLWFNGTSDLTNEQGQYNVKLSAFESSLAVYFDVNVDNKLELDNENNELIPKINNGKYYFDKNSSNYESIFSISEELDMNNMYFVNIMTHEVSLKSLIKGLHQHKYSGLKFYEKDNKFTIQLDSDYQTYKKQKSEIKNYLYRIVPVNEDQYDKFDFKFNYIFVFEDNLLVEEGVKIFIETNYKNGTYLCNQYNANYKVGDITTPKVEYDKYSEIKNFEEIYD